MYGAPRSILSEACRARCNYVSLMRHCVRNAGWVVAERIDMQVSSQVRSSQSTWKAIRARVVPMRIHPSGPSHRLILRWSRQCRYVLGDARTGSVPRALNSSDCWHRSRARVGLPFRRIAAVENPFHCNLQVGGFVPSSHSRIPWRPIGRCGRWFKGPDEVHAYGR